MTSNSSTRRGNGSPSSPKTTFFIDRSLGPQFKAALEKHGYHAQHMRDLYPNDGQDEADENWIPEIAAQGWLILTADKRMWRKPAEQRAIIESNARVFSLHNNQLREAEKGLNIGRYLLTMANRGKSPAPCFWRLKPGHPLKDLP